MMTRDEIVNRLVSEVTRVVGALLEASALSRTGTPADGDGFSLQIEGSDGQQGHLDLFFARAGAESVVKALTGSEPSEQRVLDTLKEIGAQVIAGFDKRDVGGALQIVSAQVVDAPPMPDTLGSNPPIAVDIVVNGHAQPLQIVLIGALEFVPGSVDARPIRSQTLDVIMDIDLPLVVRFGRTELPLKTLTALGPGSVIDLGRTPDEPVDVLISNRVVARGEVVIVSGHYGVRVRDVVSPMERARSLEAELA